MRILSREDRKDLARIKIADRHTSTIGYHRWENDTIERLLAWDDRDLGISREEGEPKHELLASHGYKSRSRFKVFCANVVALLSCNHPNKTD